MHTFEGRVNLTVIKNLQDSLVFSWAPFALCCAVLEGPHSISHVYVNWLSLALSARNFSCSDVWTALCCCRQPGARGCVYLFLWWHKPLCRQNILHLSSAFAWELSYPVDSNIAKSDVDTPCAGLLPSPDGGVLSLENHLTLLGRVGRITDLVFFFSRKLAKNTNQLACPQIFYEGILKTKYFACF